jgi:hypothetical protein
VSKSKQVIRKKEIESNKSFVFYSVNSQTNEEQVMYFTPVSDINDQSEPIDENRVTLSK